MSKREKKPALDTQKLENSSVDKKVDKKMDQLENTSEKDVKIKEVKEETKSGLDGLMMKLSTKIENFSDKIANFLGGLGLGKLFARLGFGSTETTDKAVDKKIEKELTPKASNGETAPEVLLGKYTINEATRKEIEKTFGFPFDRIGVEFCTKLLKICEDFSFDPNWMAAAMTAESGLKTDSFPGGSFETGSGGVGLIGFMPFVAARLLHGKEERNVRMDANKAKPENERLSLKLLFEKEARQVAAMSHIEQLDLVRKFFEKYSGQLHNVTDFYAAIFYPAAIGQPDDYVLFAKGTEKYRQNAGLDENGDGKLTKREMAHRVVGFYEQYKFFDSNQSSANSPQSMA